MTTNPSWYPFDLVPIPERLLRKSTIMAGDGGYILSMGPSSPLLLGAVYLEDVFIHFLPWWSDYCLRAPRMIEGEMFRSDDSGSFLRWHQVVLRRMFSTKLSWELPPFSFVRSYIHKTSKRVGMFQTRGDEGYTGYSTIVRARPLGPSVNHRHFVYYIRCPEVSSKEKVETILRTILPTILREEPYASWVESFYLSLSLTCKSNLFRCAGLSSFDHIEEFSTCAAKENNDCKKEPSSLLEEGEEIEPEWASLFSSTRMCPDSATPLIPSRLLHDFCSPSSTSHSDVNVWLLTLRVNQKKRTKDMNAKEEEFMNQLATKLLFDLMLRDSRLLVVGERRDHLLRGIRRQNFRSIRQGYSSKRGTSLPVPNLSPDQKGDFWRLLSSKPRDRSFNCLSVYSSSFGELASKTNMNDYTRHVQERIKDEPPILSHTIFDALHNSLKKTVDDFVPRKSVVFRTSGHSQTIPWDQMAGWALGIYPSHLCPSYPERTERPFYAQWYLLWASRTGKKVYSPLQSRQAASKGHILFCFEGSVVPKLSNPLCEPFRPPYELYAHTGLNIMLRGVPANVFVKRGMVHKFRCNKLPIYPQAMHFVPTDTELEEETPIVYEPKVIQEDIYRYSIHLMGRKRKEDVSKHKVCEEEFIVKSKLKSKKRKLVHLNIE